jgi:DNA (cytosine-5)-methyltransferase 1
MNKLKLLDLFSGIGGFSLGLESTGFFETIAL